MDQNKPEVLIMVDCETSGPIPGETDYSMLSLGAVVIGQHTPPYHKHFYVELQPMPDAKVMPEAMAVNKLDIERLKEHGIHPHWAMARFQRWVLDIANPDILCPVMVSEGTFDYMWVQWYFHHFQVRSPFGPNSLDSKSAYFGIKRCRWSQTTSLSIRERHPEWVSEHPHSHNALDDAIEQAERFSRMMQS